MTRSIDEVQRISQFVVFKVIGEGDGLGLDRDSALPFNLKFIQNLLVLNLSTSINRPDKLQDAVCQRAFPVVDVSDDAEKWMTFVSFTYGIEKCKNLGPRRNTLFLH